MRGIPKDPVTCARCASPKGCPKDSLCHSCRILGRPNPRKKFYWTPSLDQALMRAYKTANSRALLIQNINRIQQISGFSRFAIQSRAAEIGLSTDVRRPWSIEDLLFLRDNLGRLSTAAVACKLGRTYYSVKAQVSKLGMSARLTEGYTHADLQQLLGVSKRRLDKWVEMDWLRMKANRASEESVARFLRSHPGEYLLSRVDEAWFKGLVFPAFNRAWDTGWKDKATRSQLDSRYRLPQPTGDADAEPMQI